MTGNRKLLTDKLITFLVSQGPSSTRNELLGFFDMDPQSSTASALNQQHARLSPSALEAIFRHFNHFAPFHDQKKLHRRFLAADGSTLTFFNKPASAPEEYHVSEGHSMRGFYNTHLDVFYDLQKRTCSDAPVQPIRQKDEFSALCEMADYYDLLTGTKDVFIDDRGYYSYSNMAHAKEKDRYFLFHTRDIHSRRLIGNFEFPDVDSPNTQINVTLVRSHKKETSVKEGCYRRFMDAAVSFDYVVYGSLDTCDLPFRIVRFPISDNPYEYIIANLSSDGFPSEQIRLLYHARWVIEGSFHKLKYTVGLSSPHTYEPEYIKQEVWAKLITYNITKVQINHAIIEKGSTKYEYKVNFSMATRICRIFLHPNTEKGPIDMMSLLTKEPIPIWNDRQYPRPRTAHF